MTEIAVVPNDLIGGHIPLDAERISLFDKVGVGCIGEVGATLPKEAVSQLGASGATLAWDFLALSLAIIAADRHVNRVSVSADGWTRVFDLTVSVSDPMRWSALSNEVEEIANFLTGDIWHVTFADGGIHPRPPRGSAGVRKETCVSLLSGGLDSLVGALDLHKAGIEKPLFVSQRVRGDVGKQERFAEALFSDENTLSLNFNVRTNNRRPEISQRPRSLAFLAYGILAGTTLEKYRSGDSVRLLVPENGFISLNVPLTQLRAGSLSTRTTHPIFIAAMNRLLAKLDIHIEISNPYQFKTKGEMLCECADQDNLDKLAHLSMSCGRGGRHHQHCGRCLPCIVRRASFYNWKRDLSADNTIYRFPDQTPTAAGSDIRTVEGSNSIGSFSNEQFRNYDDVVQCLAALDLIDRNGIRRWIGSSITDGKVPRADDCRSVVERGIDEIREYFKQIGIYP